MMDKKDIKSQFDELLSFSSAEEFFEHEGHMLAFQFLGKVDSEMIRQGMSKKVLAEKVGTSSAYITQLFQGNRRPNWIMVAKMQAALDLKFMIKTENDWEEEKRKCLMEYHRRWRNTRSYFRIRGEGEQNALVMEALPPDEPYMPLAG